MNPVNIGVNVSAGLQQKLTFQMIQSLKMLQATTQQLEQMLRAEAEINPLLELDDDLDYGLEQDTDIDGDDNGPRADDGDSGLDRDDGGGDGDDYLNELKGGEDGIDWEEYLEEGFDLGYSYNEEADPSEERYESSPVYQETLEEHLEDQLKDIKVGERLGLLVRFLIGSLDDDGYLRLPARDIMDFTETTVNELEEALNILWRLDPPGVGARDLRECMMLQLRARGMRGGVAMKIIEDHWDLFQKLRIPDISKRLRVEPREVQEAIDVIKTLTPKPGYRYNSDKSSVIIPDLIVEKIDGKFIAILNDRTIPSLRIGKSYADMLKRGSKARKDVKDFVREKFNSASWFVKAIEQRRSTMLKVMNAIIERQKIFFAKGPPNTVPMKMQEVADMIGMHISTISRVVNGKYAQTPHGIFELRYFFTEAIRQTQAGGEAQTDAGDPDGAGGTNAVTAERIKIRVKQLVGEEDPTKPLTDQAIAEILEKEKIPAARRTVAKYREQLKIPPVKMRQKYG